MTICPSKSGVEKYKQKRFEEGAQVSVNRELSRLRTIFNLCIAWKKYENENPARHFKLAPESRGRVQFLSEAEEAALLNATKEPLQSAIVLGIPTGLRMQSEGMSLIWSNVDISGQTVTVEDHFAKNHESLTVPLNSIALETFTMVKASTRGSWVFMTRGRRKDGPWKQYRSFRTAFETGCRRANLSDVTPHTLRHTFASRLVMEGADLRTVS